MAITDGKQAAQDGLEVLSTAERRVAEAALAGGSVRDIAGRLYLSEATVKTHLAHIYAKLGIGGRLELIAAFGPHTAIEPTALATEPSSGPKHAKFGHMLWPLTAASAALLALAIWAALALSPAANPADLERLAADGGVQSMELDGRMLRLATQWSSDLVFRDIRPEEVHELAVEYGIPLSVRAASSDEAVAWWWPLSILPVAVGIGFAAALVASRRHQRRPPPQAA